MRSPPSPPSWSTPESEMELSEESRVTAKSVTPPPCGSHIAASGHRCLEEDRLLAALLADTSDKERQRVGGGRVCHGSTVNRKARAPKLLSTRLLYKHPALLDDMCPILADKVLNSVHRWQFNAFQLDRLTSGRCLPTICLHIFYKTGLLDHFSMDATNVMTFFRLLERGYHSTNPYHNALHACDVTQAMHVFCSQLSIARHVSPLERLAALVAAVSHDLDHPGVNEKFLVSTGSHLAVLYDNVSVLENHHWRSAIGCFVDSGLSKYLTESQFAEFTDLVRSLILATDISRQQEFLSQFRYFLDSGELDLSQTYHRHFILQIGIKCADISNPCRAWPVSRLWSLRACEEFFRQGDLERDLGLGITPICDRYNMTVAKVQVGFYTFVVEPLFKEWDRFLSSQLSTEMLESFYSNQSKWEEEVLQEDMSEASLNQKVPQAGPKVTSASPVFADEQLSPLPEPEEAEAIGPPVEIKPFPLRSFRKGLSGLERRMSLPSHDPLHRIFDQMLQPDPSADTATRAVNLKRNFSLTDRRRSSLLRGMHNRSSLKPARNRAPRPSSMCSESGSDSQVAGEQKPLGHSSRMLKPVENRLEETAVMEVNVDEDAGSLASRPSLGEQARSNFPTATGSEMAVVEEICSGVGEKENAAKLKFYERLTQRRGSAPSNLILGDSNSGQRQPQQAMQPINIANLVGSSYNAGSLRHQNALLNKNTRRGSLPTDLLRDSLPKQLRNRIQMAAASAAGNCGAGGNSQGGANTAGNGGMTGALSGKSVKGQQRRRSMGQELMNVNVKAQKYHNRPF